MSEKGKDRGGRGCLPILGLVFAEVVHLHRLGHPWSLWYRYIVRSIHILRAVIPGVRLVRLFSSGRSHIFLHHSVSVHTNSYRAGTGNVGHVRWVSSCVHRLSLGMHKSEIVPRDNSFLDAELSPYRSFRN